MGGGQLSDQTQRRASDTMADGPSGHKCAARRGNTSIGKRHRPSTGRVGRRGGERGRGTSQPNRTLKDNIQGLSRPCAVVGRGSTRPAHGARGGFAEAPSSREGGPASRGGSTVLQRPPPDRARASADTWWSSGSWACPPTSALPGRCSAASWAANRAASRASWPLPWRGRCACFPCPSSWRKTRSGSGAAPSEPAARSRRAAARRTGARVAGPRPARGSAGCGRPSAPRTPASAPA
mmetsp:Transcript_13057/g.34734  ORF Transcript_13057/g.34734 Transcript_13057/m.34734 type:complete len:237 (-) Transcript_13057:281-991(-)